MKAVRSLFGNVMVLGFIFASLDLPAAESFSQLEGVKMSKTMTLEDGKQLELNGMGLRKYFWKYYVAGLYVEKKSTDAEEIINSAGPKVLQIQFLRKVDRSTLVSALEGGYAVNCGDDCKAYQPIRDLLTKELKDGKEGTVLSYSFIPGSGVTLTQEKAIHIPADDNFLKIILKIWLSETPADLTLKDGLLGL